MQNEMNANQIDNAHIESQVALNADLMLNNIYQSQEFNENEDLQKKILENEEKQDGRDTKNLIHHNDNDRLGSDNEDKLTKINTKNAGVGVNALTPTPPLMQMPNKNTLNEQSSISMIAGGDTSPIKNAKSPKLDGFHGNAHIIGELDVETNYLRSSA